MTTVAQILTFNEFQPQMLVLLAIIIVLLCASAMLSGAETAFFSLSPGEINRIKKKGSKANEAIIKLLSTQDYLLATVLIANNLVNICIVILSNNLIDMTVSFGDNTGWEFVIKTIIVTFVLLLFGEITPKIFSAYHPLKFARFISVPLQWLKYILKPFSYILIHSGSKINKRLTQKGDNISIGELSNAIEITQTHSDEEKQMLSGIVNFVNTEAAEIMKLRIDIIALDIASDFKEVKKCFIDSGFSRIPVYEDNIDHIKGILYVKDMTPFISQPDTFNWQPYIRDAYFVPEHKKINDLLEEFQAQKVHMAVVVDEYGATQGLVSLEDILEEVVGEITDESDLEEQTFYKKIDDNNYMFEGKTHLSDFEKVLKLDSDFFADLSGGTETIAGLMLELKHDFLKKGESVSSRGIIFTVDVLNGRRIEKIRVRVEQKVE